MERNIGNQINETTRLKIISSLVSLCKSEQESSMVHGAKVKEKIESFFQHSQISYETARRVWNEPRKFLGNFSELPLELRSNMARSAAFFDKENALCSMQKLRDFALKPLWKIGHLLLSISLIIEKASERSEWRMGKYGLILLKKIFGRLGFILTWKNVGLFHKLIDFFRFTRFYRQPFLFALWVYLNIEIRELMFSYIEKIPVNPKFGPVFLGRTPAVECCAIVGIDLLPSEGQLYLLETNFNAALRPERVNLYKRDQDPIGQQMINYASKRMYERIIVYGPNYRRLFDPSTEKEWREIAKKRNIEFQIIDDLFSGSIFSHRQKRNCIAFPCRDKTMNVLVNSPNNAVFRKLIWEKGNLERLIERDGRPFLDEQRINLPEIVTDTGYHCEVARDERFPRIIIKHIRKDKGLGLLLLNTDKVPIEYFSKDFMINRYVVPDRIKKSVNGKVLEFAYIYRSHILLTAEGPQYLGSHRVRSVAPIPDRKFQDGTKNISPFIVNFGFGAQYETIDPTKDKDCESASLAIGKVICQFAGTKFSLELGAP